MPDSKRTPDGAHSAGADTGKHHIPIGERLLNWLIGSSGLLMASVSDLKSSPDGSEEPDSLLAALDYRQFFERSQAVQLFIDPQNGSIIDANPAAARFYGYPRDVLRTMHIDAINVLEHEDGQAEIQRASAEEKNYFQLRHRLASGEICDVEVHSSPVDVQGKTILYSIIHDISDRVRAEDALHASELRMRAIFDQSMEFIGLLEPDGTITEINLTGLEYSGLSSEDVIGKPLWEAKWWEDHARPQIKQAVEAAARGEMRRFEVTLRGRNAQTASVDFSIKPVLGDDGSVVMLIPEARDISHIKRVVNTLQETNQALEAIVNSSPLPIMALDSTGAVTMWNPAAAAAFLWEAGEILGRPLPILPSENHDQLTSIIRTVLAGESIANPEIHAIRKDSSPLTLNVSSSPLRGVNGDIDGIMLIAMDVTERLTASRALAQSEQQLRALFEAMPDVVLVVDERGVCLRASSTAGNPLARDIKQMVGSSLDDIFPPDETMRYKEFLQLALDAGQTIRIEYPTQLDQAKKWYVASITPMSENEILWVARDVTSRKRSEVTQSALYRIASIAGSAEDMDSFYESLHQVVGELMYARNFYIALAGPQPGMMHFPYFVDETEIHPQDEEPRAGLTGLVLDTGKPVLITDKAVQEKVHRGEITAVGPSAVDWMGVPLSAGGETFGVLAVQSYSPEVRFDEDDLELLIYVSRHISGAIDRKRAADEVRQSEERYRTLIETSPDAVLYMDVDAIIEVVNPNGAQLFGYESEVEMQGLHISELTVPEEKDFLPKVSAALIGGESLAHFEAALVRRDGSRFPAELSASLTQDSEGNPRGFVVILRDITERRRIENAAKEQRELAEALRDTAAALNSTLELNELLDRVLENVERVVPHDAANVIILKNGLSETVRWKGYKPAGVTEDSLKVVSNIADFPNMVRTMETLAPYIVKNTRVYPGWQPQENLRWIASNICTPIVYQGTVLGFLNVDSKAEDFFTDDHARRLGAFADQVAVALQNARLYESERKQLILSQTLQEVGALLTSQLGLEEVLENIFDLLRNVVPYDAVSFLRVAPGGGLEQVAARGQREPEKSRQFLEGQHVSDYEKRWKDRPVSVLPNTLEQWDWVREDGVHYTKSWIGAALRVKGELIGILNLDSYTQNTYDESVGETVVAFANQAAIAIENARLYESEHRQRRIAELISETTAAVASSLDTGQVLLTMATRLREISGFDACGIYDWDPDSKQFRSVSEQGRIVWQGDVRPVYVLKDYPVMERVLRTGVPSFVYTGSIDAHPSELIQMELRGLRGLAMFPLRSGEEIIGLLELGGVHGPRSLSDERFSKVQKVLDRASTYLQATLESADTDVLFSLAKKLIQTGAGQWCVLSAYKPEKQQAESLIEYSDLVWGIGESVTYAQEDHPGSSRAATTGEIVVSRLSQLPEEDPQAVYLRKAALGMIVHIPILSHGNVLGLVELSHLDGETLVSTEDLHLWGVIVDQTAIALENARLYESEQRQRRAAEIISATTTAAVSSLNPGDVMLTLASRLRELAGAHTSTIFEWNVEQNQLRAVTEHSNAITSTMEETFALADYPAAARVLQTGEPAYYSRTNWDVNTAEKDLMVQRGLYSFLMLPLRSGDQIVGLVEIAHTGMLENPERVLRQAAELLGAASDRVPPNLRENPQAGNRALLALAKEIVDAGMGPWCAISAWQSDGLSVQTCAAYSEMLWETEPGPVYDLGAESGARRVVERGETVILRLTDPDLTEVDAARLNVWGWQMAILMPITIKGQVIGMLEMGHITEDQVITEPDQKLWRVVVDQAAVALENARLFTQSQKRNDRLALLNEITRTGTEVLEMNDLLQTLAASAKAIIGGTESYITLWDQQNRLVVPAAAYGPMRDTFRHDPPSTEEELTITLAVLRDEKPLAIEDLLNHPSVDPEIAARFPTKSILALPMIVDGGWLGAVLIGFDRPHQFTDEEIEWAMQAVELIGLAIAKAQAYEEMEHRVETRTAELTAANERMQVLSRIRDEFVSNVSHELRTPITSIKLHHHLMNLRPENSAVYMDRLIRETGRLEHIVSDLLRLSELDRGKLELILLPTDVHELANNYVTDRSLIAEDRGLTLIYEPTEDLPLVHIDSKLIGQSLSILLTNAMAYTPQGGKIIVRTSARSKDGQDWVVLSVSDTGPGVSPEDMGELFQRFFRGKIGRSSDEPGTGLGLAIAREIVNRHQGRIEAISEGIEGKGSTFNIWLPVIEAANETTTG